MDLHHNTTIVCNSNDDFDDPARDGDLKTLTRPETKIKKPSMYKVLLLNDDFTPMDFVIHVLVKFFKKSSAEATEIMMNVHHKGAGLCGVFPFEIAETKVHQVNSQAKLNKHPLKCVLEAE